MDLNYTNYSDSWIWEEPKSLDYTNTCEEITNHWLFFIFTGYLLPLVSPRVRAYLKHITNDCKKSKLGGNLISLTEFGFEKIQDIENNEEMKQFIKRLCEEKKINLNEELLEKLSWLFSGDSDDNHQSIQQTWKKLNKMLEELKNP